MLIKLLAAPIIGAIIGYCTNWVAVKMLFRPRKAVYIGKFHVPLTPGVIPKGKARLAAAVGKVLNEQLLTKEAVEARLLSDEVTGQIRKAAEDIVAGLKEDRTTTIRQLATRHTDSTGFELAVNKLEITLTDRAYDRLLEAGLGDTVSKYMSHQVYEMFSGSFFGSMLGDSLQASLVPAISQAVDGYVEQNGRSIISGMIREEMSNMEDMPAAKLVDGIESTGYDIAGTVEDLYRSFVKNKAYDLIRTFDMGSIAADSINAMDNEQLEKLVLDTMHTELSAVVNFGAVIGLALGLINMLIYFL